MMETQTPANSISTGFRTEEKACRRILIADDDPIQRAMASYYLESCVGPVEHVENGKDCLKRLSSNEFDILLLDIDMPELNGFETLALIRSDPRWTKLTVILVTSRNILLKGAQSLGAASAMNKPVN